jgi:hypothetical protein
MLLLFLLSWLHPMHVSVTEIDYNEKNKSLEIMSRIFIDDLETSIRKAQNNETLDLLKPTGTTTDQLVSQYLMSRLLIQVNGKPANPNYIAHEIDGAAMICYLEIESVKAVKTLDITISVIQELYDDQSNLVHVTYRGPVKSLRLTKEKPEGTLSFP